jgi:uncharacterized membrane protein
MHHPELVFRWLHILPAIALVGGVYFWRWALLPALGTLDDSARKEIHDRVRPLWARCVMISSGLLLVTGLTNAVRNILRYDFIDGRYHGLVLAKLILALVIFWLSAKLAGRSASAEKFRQNETKWVNMTAFLATILVLLAGYMRAQDRVEPDVAAVKISFESDSNEIDGIESDGIE